MLSRMFMHLFVSVLESDFLQSKATLEKSWNYDVVGTFAQHQRCAEY